jgi:hypothetical protein
VHGPQAKRFEPDSTPKNYERQRRRLRIVAALTRQVEATPFTNLGDQPFITRERQFAPLAIARLYLAMARELIWQVESGMLGCSECGWVFRPGKAPHGKTMAEMERDFLAHRDKDFAEHVCGEHPAGKPGAHRAKQS